MLCRCPDFFLKRSTHSNFSTKNLVLFHLILKNGACNGLLSWNSVTLKILLELLEQVSFGNRTCVNWQAVQPADMVFDLPLEILFGVTALVLQVLLHFFILLNLFVLILHFLLCSCFFVVAVGEHHILTATDKLIE